MSVPPRPTPGKRTVSLASGERVTYAMGVVAIHLNDEDHTTIFLITGLLAASTP